MFIEGRIHMGIVRLDIITTMTKLTGLKEMLSRKGISGMTVSQVLGCGVQNGTREYELGKNAEMELLPKELVTIFVDDENLDQLLKDISKELYTGHIGDGKIFVSDVRNAIRVRTGEDGIDALR